MGKKDAKAVNMCSKCTVPLHPKCFCAYHIPNTPRPNWMEVSDPGIHSVAIFINLYVRPVVYHWAPQVVFHRPVVYHPAR